MLAIIILQRSYIDCMICKPQTQLAPLPKLAIKQIRKWVLSPFPKHKLKVRRPQLTAFERLNLNLFTALTRVFLSHPPIFNDQQPEVSSGETTAFKLELPGWLAGCSWQDKCGPHLDSGDEFGVLSWGWKSAPTIRNKHCECELLNLTFERIIIIVKILK